MNTQDTVCPNCGHHIETKAERPQSGQEFIMPDPQIIRVFGPGYDSNEAATALTLGQKIFRWRTVKALTGMAAMDAGASLAVIKGWPLITGKTYGATANIGSFQGAQSLNDVMPLLLALGALFLAIVIPMAIGIWWWRREPYRLPWDVPMANTGQILAETPRLERQAAIVVANA